MTTVHHLNCGFLHNPPSPRALCHCLLLEDPSGLALVDTGIGVEDVADPRGRIGQALIDAAGFQFNAPDTAVMQIERLGLSPWAVRHVVLTHADPDHTGGLADFPLALVHVSAEELAALEAGHQRYVPAHFEQPPKWVSYEASDVTWFGMPARRVALGMEAEVLLVPLFGHTAGHCGVAIRQGGRWLLHVGDAYYLRVETETDDHPVSVLAAANAFDDAERRRSLREIKRLMRDHADEIDFTGYHDAAEFPATLSP